MMKASENASTVSIPGFEVSWPIAAPVSGSINAN